MLQMPRIGCLLKLTARIYIVCVPFRVLIHLATRPQSVASGSQMQMCIHQYLNPPFAAIGKDSQDNFLWRSTLHPKPVTPIKCEFLIESKDIQDLISHRLP